MDGFRDETQAYVFFILFEANKRNVFTGHTNLLKFTRKACKNITRQKKSIL